MSTKTSCCPVDSTSAGKKLVSNLFKTGALLFFIVLFSTKVSAQQPACNLVGPLKAVHTQDGGTTITITADVFNAQPNSRYVWSLRSNSSGAVLGSGQGTPSINLLPGTRKGNFALQLMIVNPGQGSTQTCTCVTSVSVNDN